MRPRIIPVLLLSDEGVVKTTNFKDRNYIGDPLNTVKVFNDLKVDELVLLDIDATKNGRTISIELVKEIGSEANMPISVGGGIKDLQNIRDLISAGAEKVILNSYAIQNPEFIRDAVNEFGSSTISVCIDYKKKIIVGDTVYIKNGTHKVNFDPLKLALLVEEMGAGEVILQSIDRDGKMVGADIELIKKLNKELKIPLVVLGGVGSKSDIEEIYNNVPVNGIAAGSYFVYQGKLRGILIQYPPISTYSFASINLKNH